ncbi:MAG: UDP-N-acetylglucosamine 2-epimerase (hydrolyzing) [Leptospirales bacterium]|nr:UDP-N-acetylglucosamine 2-epimerase (hydrolyzing) [Leptospirales bacterium]
MIRVCFVTGGRAEYGLLRWVMEEVRESPDMNLQILATGAHLSAAHGATIAEIERDGFTVSKRVEMLLADDSPGSVVKSMGLELIGLADAFRELQPEWLVLLGDRYEILMAATAALICRIPIAHVHGGEISEGAFDDSIRHAITKMSHLHFVACEEYARRVVQLGEEPDRVYNVGGLGIESIRRLRPLNLLELESDLQVSLKPPILLTTFHPATLDPIDPGEQMGCVLRALAAIDEATILFTMPNADPGNATIRSQIQQFCSDRPRAFAFESLGQLRYLSCMAVAGAVVGNSSSGLLEAPGLGTPTVNIGIRQAGRVRASSVIDCSLNEFEIAAAIRRSLTPGFRANAGNSQNPFGDGFAAKRIVSVIRSFDRTKVASKHFHDVTFPVSGSARDATCPIAN